MKLAFHNPLRAPAEHGHRPRTRFIEADDPPDRYDQVIEALVVAVLVFAPLAFGAVAPWAQAVVFLLVAAASICLLLKFARHPGARLVWTPAYVPVVLFLLIGGFQLIPLPTAFVKLLSPETAAIKTRLLSDLPDAPQILRKMTLSFYPLATRQLLRIVLAAAALFTVVVNVYRRPEQVRRLLIAITLVGGAIALLALAQDLTHATGIYWDHSLSVDKSYRATSGSFVNYNNFAQYMNLSIGAALGLLLSYVTEAGSSLSRKFAAAHRDLDRRRALIMIGLGVFILAGGFCIFFSGSRGGMIAFLVAFGLTMLLLASRRAASAGAWAIIVVALVVGLGVLYFGFDTAYSRLGSLSDLQKASPVRWDSNQDVWKMWPHFRLTGVGLGDHEMAYPMFAGNPWLGRSEQLENDYLQLLEEMGLSGAVCVALFLLVLGVHFVKAVRRADRPKYTVIFGLGFGLVAVMAHSASDFGQRILANACLSAVICGLIVNLGRKRPEMKPTTANAGAQKTAAHWARWVMLAPAVIVWGWVLLGAARDAVADAFWRQAIPIAEDLKEQGWQGDDGEFKRLISHADDACFVEPEDVQHLFNTATYRWFSISRVYDKSHTHVLLTDAQVAYTRRIISDLNQARILCPTYGAFYCEAGQLELFVFKNPIGKEHIRTGFMLAPSHPIACFVAGRLDAEEGHWDASIAEFRRAIALAYPLREILDIYINSVNRPDLALELVNDRRDALLYLADRLKKADAYPDVQQKALDRAEVLLQLAAARPDASPSNLAAVAAELYQSKHYKEAIDKYRAALDSEDGNATWHYELARALEADGQLDEAMNEVRISLRFSPGTAPAIHLLEELSMLSATRPSK